MRFSSTNVRLVLAATTAIGIASTGAHATVVSYTGANDGNWDTAGNWSNAKVPTGSEDLQFTNGNTAELSAGGTSAGLISTQTNPGGIELDGFNLSVTGNTTNNDTFWGDITNGSATTAKVTFGANTSTASQTFDGSIGSNINLVVSGDTLTLGAANTYGNTTVSSGGTLDAAANNALSSGNAVSVDATGVLNSSANETVSSLVNKGAVNITGGSFNATGGFTNANGTIGIGNGATLATGASANTVNILTLGSGGTLAVGTNGTVTVSGDYNNLNAGSGSSYNRLANVTGTGVKVDAAGKGTLETISTNGSTPSTTLAAGNVHVGSSDAFLIENTGANDPSLRGAVATSSSNLSAPGTFGPIATGSNVSIPVEFTAAGVLNGSTLVVESNFSNIANQTVTVTGTAYNYAAPVVQKSGSLGVLTGGGTSYTLALGTFAKGSASVESSLDVLNELLGGATSTYTDALDGSFQGLTGPFTLAGFGAFSAIGGGSTTGPFDISFDPLSDGFYSEVITLDPVSDNSAGLGDTPLDPITIDLTANVVPEPAALSVLLSGLGGVWFARRRRRR